METGIIAKESGNANTRFITLSDWLVKYYNYKDLDVLFSSMDSAMKYIHNKGYCIASFNPSDVQILNSSLRQIKFNSLLEMPKDIQSRKEIIKEDIFKSAFLQVGIYSKSLNKLTPSGLKENFGEFSMLLPADFVPYYRGVIERNASVYLGDFLIEKRKRDLVALEKEVNGDGASTMMDENNLHFDSMNSAVNDSIYKQLNNRRDGRNAAFISYVAIPILLVILGLILSILLFCFR